MELVEPTPALDLIIRHAAYRRRQSLSVFSAAFYDRALADLARPRVLYFSEKSEADCAFFAHLVEIFANGDDHLRQRGPPLACCTEPLASATELVLLSARRSASELDNEAAVAALEAQRRSADSSSCSPLPAGSEDDESSSDSIQREMGKGTYSAVEELCGAAARSERHGTARLRLCSHLVACMLLLGLRDFLDSGRPLPLRLVAQLVAGPPRAATWLHKRLTQKGDEPMALTMTMAARYVNVEQFLAAERLGVRVDPHLMNRYLERRLHGHVEMRMHLHQRACWYSSHDPETGAARPLAITHRQALKAVYYSFVLWEFTARPDEPPPASGSFDLHELATILEAICNSCSCIEPTVPAHGPRRCGHEDSDPRHRHTSLQCSFLTLWSRPLRPAEARDVQRLWQLHSLVRWSVYHGTPMLMHHPSFRNTPAERLCGRLPLLIDQALPSTREMGVRHDSEPVPVAYVQRPPEEVAAAVGSLRPGTASVVARFLYTTEGRGGDHGAAVVRFSVDDIDTALLFFARLLAPENRLVALKAPLLSESAPAVVRTDQYAYVLLRRWMLRAARAFSTYRVLGSRRSLVGTGHYLNAEYIMQEYLRGDQHELYYAMKLLWHTVSPKSRSVGFHGGTRRIEDSLEPVGADDRCDPMFYRLLHRLVGKAVRGCGTTLREHVASIWRRATCWRECDFEAPREPDGTTIPGLLFEPRDPRDTRWQVRNDRLPARALDDACREPFMLRGLQSFLEMRLPHFLDVGVAQELLRRFDQSPELADRHWQICSVLRDAPEHSILGHEAGRRGVPLPLVFTLADRSQVYPHWLLYRLALDDAIDAPLAYRIFCGTVTHSGFAFRNRAAVTLDRAQCDVEDAEWYLLRDLGKRKAEELGDAAPAPADPARREKFGARNRAARPTPAEEDRRFEQAARPSAEQRPLAIAPDCIGDLEALWELIRIACSEARVSHTPHRARLLQRDAPLESTYKYVIGDEWWSPRSAVLRSLISTDYDGSLPDAQVHGRLAADCEASRITDRLSTAGPMSMLAVRDESIVRRCLFDGAMPPQPCYYSGVNNYRLPSLCEALPTRALLRVLAYTDDWRAMRLVCRQWRTLVDRLWNVLPTV